MQQIPIQTVPNQQFTIILDNNQWDISIKMANDNIVVSLTLNDVSVVENIRAVADKKIIPFEYQESGNFAFITLNQELPDYEQFGISQTLIYISQGELDALRAPTSALITADDFNPLGDLPLRFKPQGYMVAP